MFSQKLYLNTILHPKWQVLKQNERSAVDLVYNVHGPSVSKSQKHIIVLHGLLGSKRNWDSMSRRITAATKVCVIAPDARNHGDSPHGDSHSYLDLALDTSQLMKKLGIKKAHFIGHSMGGRTAMTLALSEPSKVESLVAADISPITAVSLTNDFFPQLIKTMKNVNFQGAANLTAARNAANEAFKASGLVENVEHLGFIIMNVGQLGDNAFGWKYNVEVLKKDFPLIASFPSELMGKKYPGPTLFVAGGQSDYVPKSDEPRIRELFPELVLTYIDHVGHNVHAEDPSAFFNVVSPFLQKVLK